MIILKGSVEQQPTEFDGKVYGGVGDILYSETLEDLIGLVEGVDMMPLKIGEKLVIEAVEMSAEEFAEISDYNG